LILKTKDVTFLMVVPSFVGNFTKGMKVQLVYSSKVPINGTITKPEGKKTLLIKAEKTAVGLIVKVEEK